MLPGRSIRTRIVVGVMALVTLFYGCFGAYLYFGFHGYLIHALRATLARRAHQVASTIVAEIPEKGEGYVGSEVEARFAPELNERVVWVGDASGRTVYVSSARQALPVVELPPWPEKEHESPPAGDEITDADGRKFEVVAVAYRTSGGIYRVEVGGPEDQVALELRGLLLMLAMGFPFFLLLTATGAYALVGRALRPVDRIVRSAETITAQNLSERLPIPATEDEIARLSVALNRMIQRLDEAFQQASRFSADASHELRTPLTIVQGELEVLLADASLGAAHREQLESVLEETNRLTQIVQGLLVMSRLEGGEAQLKRTRFDLCEMVRNTEEQLRPLAAEKRIEIRCEGDDPVLIEADEMRIQRVVVNLLDNAIKYTTGQGTIRVTTSLQAGHGCLEVRDSGMGIGAEALPRVFERFYRSGQPGTAAVEGAGLGLAIVKTIVEAHGGTVSIQSREAQGTTVRVELPIRT